MHRWQYVGMPMPTTLGKNHKTQPSEEEVGVMDTTHSPPLKSTVLTWKWMHQWQ